MSVQPAVKHFACTQCGKCCNRSPEIELSEAGPLSDIFVFRLLFRLYWQPQQLSDLEGGGLEGPDRSAIFYEKKRLLSAFAARKYPVKLRGNGKRVFYTKYLMISALALDTRSGACSALRDGRCGIYERRPLTCRSVPLHYSRAEGLAESQLQAFVETEGYRCDISEAAPVIIKDGRIVDQEIIAARSAALIVAERDRPWSEAIARRMNQPSMPGPALPTIEEVEANADFGALTTSMAVAWQIAVRAGLMKAEEYQELIARQLKLIDDELRTGRCSNDARQTLREMQADYRSDWNSGHAIAAGR